MIKQNRMPKITIRGTYYNSRTLPSLNDYISAIGRNPQCGNKFKKDYSRIIVNAIRRCLKNYKVQNPPVILHYRYFESSKGRKRDIGNIHGLCQKFTEDALQDCGVLGGDDPRWVAGFSAEFFWIDTEPYIEILLEEVGE